MIWTRLKEIAGCPGRILMITGVISFRILTGSNILFVYLLSYGFHIINLTAFCFRNYSSKRFLRHSLTARSIAVGLIGVLVAQHAGSAANWYALIPLVLGTALHAMSVKALGLQRTYYGVELGELAPRQIRSFPYGCIPHPMECGAILQFVGIHFLFPSFAAAHPFLIPGHIAFGLLTAFVEHYDIHFDNKRFSAVVGKFEAPGLRQCIDELRTWVLENYRDDLRKDCSRHDYVKRLPSNVLRKIDQLRYSSQLMHQLKGAFPDSTVASMWMTDEVYVSRYNLDGGGDQGLFDRHYDGNLGYLPGVSVVRSLIYLSANDRLEVVFDTSGERSNMETYDYGMLDFHKELHWVDGTYDPESPPRVLLKCNYLVDHTNNAAYRGLCIGLNLAVFYVVRAAMELSKNPHTFFQRCVGFACNFFRRLNNLNPAAPLAAVLLLVAATCRAVLLNY